MCIKCISFCFLKPSTTVCLRTQRQAIRVTLKELESLSFDIASNDVLKNFLEEVQALKAKYQQNAPKEMD